MTDLGFDAPGADGFRAWRAEGEGGFLRTYGPIRARDEGDGRVRCRIDPEPRHLNIGGAIHGGFILAYVDQSVYVGPYLQGRMPQGGAVTVTADCTFVSAGVPGVPLDAVVEVVGETGRMLFMRGLMEQDGRRIASFSATLRKMSAGRRPAEG